MNRRLEFTVFRWSLRQKWLELSPENPRGQEQRLLERPHNAVAQVFDASASDSPP